MMKCRISTGMVVMPLAATGAASSAGAFAPTSLGSTENPELFESPFKVKLDDAGLFAWLNGGLAERNWTIKKFAPEFGPLDGVLRTMFSDSTLPMSLAPL